jgi:hypothetical protein
LEQIGTLFTPDTILRWHRLLEDGLRPLCHGYHSGSVGLSFSNRTENPR